MPKTYFLLDKSRPLLKKPWGSLIAGNVRETASKYSKIVKKLKYPLIVTVGDYCSRHLDSDIKIFDNKVKRLEFKSTHGFCLTVTNPAGTIQKESWLGVKHALKRRCNLAVIGEEDLFVIPAVLLSKAGTLVVYGLPDQGVCCIEVTPAMKKTFRQFLKENFSTKK